MGSVSVLNSFTYLIISSELIQIKTPCPCYILCILLDQKAKVKGDRARSALLLTGEESYDKERYIELLLRAAETLLAPLGYPADRIQSHLDPS